eukprot:SAG11_NODE_7427_length_1146_cov_0.862464_1_plen_42_part_01
MADVGTTHEAGNQLRSLSRSDAIAAVREAALLHARFWGVGAQ